MTTRVQTGITAGMALVGAGVVAAIPVAQQAPHTLRSAEADVALAAVPVQPPYTQPVPELFALSAQRTATGLVGAPVGLASAAIALATGQNAAEQDRERDCRRTAMGLQSSDLRARRYFP